MFHNEEQQVRSFWFIALGFLIIMVAQSILTLPGTVYILSKQETIDMSLLLEGDITGLIGTSAINMFIVAGVSTFGSFLVTLLIWKLINQGTLKQLGFRGPMCDLVFGLLAGAISITIIFGLLLVSGNVSLETPWTQPQFSSAILIYLILYIFVGFFEETFFRGYVIETMISRGNKEWVIYLFSALFFSAVHGTNPGVNLLGLLNIVLVGFLFAYMYLATKSLWLPIGYHITWNFFQGSVFGFKVSGTNADSLYQISIESGNNLLTGGAFGMEGGVVASLVIALGFIITRLYVKMFH